MALLSKAWSWVKKSWKLLVGLLVGIVVTALTLGRGADGFKVLKVLRKSEEELDEKIDDELASQAEREKRIDAETQKRSGINHSIVLVFALGSLHDDILRNRIIQHNLSTIEVIVA